MSVGGGGGGGWEDIGRGMWCVVGVVESDLWVWGGWGGKGLGGGKFFFAARGGEKKSYFYEKTDTFLLVFDASRKNMYFFFG